MFNCLKKKEVNIDKIKNLGHRLFGDVCPPENSMCSMGQGDYYQLGDNFKYWELDVTESLDSIPYVNHDATRKKTIKRLYNVTSGYEFLLKQSFYELSSSVIDKHLRLKNGETVPKLDDILKRLVVIATKPIKVEIKKLNSNLAKKSVIDSIVKYQKQTDQEISCIMFKKKFKKMNSNKFFKKLCDDNNIKLKLMGWGWF